MSNINKQFERLEILIATKDRYSLDFLKKMFGEINLSSLDILIVNQTSKEVLLKSNMPNIRVINSFDYGLSKSRNIALQNAIHDIVLIADDDVVYEKDFVSNIIYLFNKHPNAAFITFKVNDLSGMPYRDYTKSTIQHSLKSIKPLISIEIAFNCKIVKELKVSFNNHFGLGSTFATAEEYIFCRDILKSGGKGYFNNAHIVSHPEHSSGKEMGSDRVIYARAALAYKVYGILAFFWLIKYTLYMWKDGYIAFKEIPRKFKMGLQGISKYKLLESSSKIDKVYVN